MARSSLRVRFVFNQKAGIPKPEQSRQRFGKDFAATMVRDLTFRAAEEEYQSIRQRIQTSFASDARRELTHIAALYRRHIIGAGKTKSRPSGMLGYALEPAAGPTGRDDGKIPISASLPDWAPRSEKYMREKERNNWGAQWFSARGNLMKNMRADTLLAAFGPIRVSVKRNLGSQPSRTFDAGGQGKINVATVRVFALTNITPAMIPGLRDLNPTAAISDRGNPGLWQLMHDHVGPAFASSVSGFSSRETGHKYRPTLEPFLQFYLTRSIPNALALRLQEGRLKTGRRFNG